MRMYETRSGHLYRFKNGRVTCLAHGEVNTPFWNFHFTKQGCMRFRTPDGWYHTTPVVEVIV